MRPERTVRIGSRASDLAQWQSHSVETALKRRLPGLKVRQVVLTTQGDLLRDQPLPEIGGKGLFTLEIESALSRGEIDLAVHSLKDLPTQWTPGLILGAVPSREDPRDVLVASDGRRLHELPAGAVVGTSSLRREVQLRRMRPDVEVRSIRGNVETRLKKVMSGEYEAAVMAAAGLIRLGLAEHGSDWFNEDEMMPAPGQGALAVQCREDDEWTRGLLSAIDKPDLRRSVASERAFLARLEAGCSAPVGALATSENGLVQLTAAVFPIVEGDPISVSGEGNDPILLGNGLAEECLAQGAGKVLAVD